jgi:hypothetical protein
VENPENSTNDGESQRNQQIDGAQDKGVDEDHLEGFPHILVSSFKLQKGIKINQPCCMLIGWFLPPPPLIINWDFLSRLF